jgi:dTDP-4-amino-4,6-dideoxygalactose transaminase
MINVTKSFLPPMEEYSRYIQEIWQSGHLTNHGPLVIELEAKLKEFLGVKHFFFVNNGTIALQIAIKALGLRGEIITTPFSYVATTSSILWEGCTPVFADICKASLTLDPVLIEKLIKPSTCAILATHVYGLPCLVEEIQRVAEKFNLKIIYDAAHAFGVAFKGKGILNYGDVSTLSFHATKLFHTVEGGGIATNDDEIAHRIAYMRNFGHNGPEQFFGIGINGKASEFNAAMGLSIFPHIPEIVSSRKIISEVYDSELMQAEISRPTIPAGTEYNYAYYPILFQSEAKLLVARGALNAENIFPRRYFFPSLNKLEFLDQTQQCGISEELCRKVLCLPLYPDLDLNDVQFICEIIKRVL